MEATLDGSLTRMRGLVLVAAAATLLIGVRLGAAPLLDPGEARHALAALEMVERDAWIEPSLNGEPYRHKPSAFYVLVGLCYRVLGVSEVAARVVPAVCSWLTLLAVYWFASRYSITRGLLAAALLASCGFFVLVGRFTNLDAFFTCLVSTAALCFAAWLRNGARWQLRSSYTLAGLAVLAKGPAALILIAVPALATLALGGRAIREAEPARGLLIVTLIAAAWYVPAWFVSPEYVVEFLAVHNFARFLGENTIFHPEPTLFFVPILAAALLPWSLHVPAACLAALRSAAVEQRFLVLYALWVVAFFSLSRGKLATYVLPAFPAFAVLTACWVPGSEDADRPGAELARRLTLVAAVFAVACTPTAVGLVTAFAPSELHISLLFIPVSTTGLLVLLQRNRMRSAAKGLGILAAGAIATVFSVNLFAGPAMGRYASDHDLALAALDHGPVSRTISYRIQPYSFLFYTRRTMEMFHGRQTRAQLGPMDSTLLLTRRKRLAELEDVLDVYAVEVIGENARHILLHLRGIETASRPR